MQDSMTSSQICKEGAHQQLVDSGEARAVRHGAGSSLPSLRRWWHGQDDLPANGVLTIYFRLLAVRLGVDSRCWNRPQTLLQVLLAVARPGAGGGNGST